MMKFIFVCMFMNFMLVKNKMIMFYYNLFFLFSFIMIFLYNFKDVNLWISMSLSFGINCYSMMLIILSLWILGLMLMCLNKVNSLKLSMFFLLVLILIMFFSFMDMLMFYLAFEISLIPIFFMIIYWGSNPERVSAAYYLMMYMLLISFPLLLYIFKIFLNFNTMKFNLLILFTQDNYMFSFWEFLLIYTAFFIKMPIYILHMWLPKAHVEAPVYGSMILAGILLKMGSYGLIRLFELFINASMNYNFMVMSVSLVGSVLIGILCMGQIDMKSLVAYSSVVHMNMMLCSLLSLFKMGFLSGYIMMISHGLCSSGMFYMVNIYYSRTMSRLLILNKGMMSIMPFFSIWWFILCAANFSFPLSINFFSEILILGTMLNWEMISMIYMMLVCFFSSAYSLYLYSYVQHGFYYLEIKFIMGEVKEFMVLIMHLFPLVVMILNMVFFM